MDFYKCDIKGGMTPLEALIALLCVTFYTTLGKIFQTLCKLITFYFFGDINCK